MNLSMCSCNYIGFWHLIVFIAEVAVVLLTAASDSTNFRTHLRFQHKRYPRFSTSASSSLRSPSSSSSLSSSARPPACCWNIFRSAATCCNGREHSR